MTDKTDTGRRRRFVYECASHGIWTDGRSAVRIEAVVPNGEFGLPGVMTCPYCGSRLFARRTEDT